MTPGVVNVSSRVYERVDAMPLDDLNFEHYWGGIRPYCATKLANILFTNELHRHTHERGLAAFSVHPGVVATNFVQNFPTPLRMVLRVARPLLRSPEQGAAPVVELVADQGPTRRRRRLLRPSHPHRTAAACHRSASSGTPLGGHQRDHRSGVAGNMSITNRDELIAALQQDSEEFQEAVSRLPAEAFERGIYEQGWNARQLLAHIAAIEWTYPSPDRTGRATSRWRRCAPGRRSRLRHERLQRQTGGAAR